MMPDEITRGDGNMKKSIIGFWIICSGFIIILWGADVSAEPPQSEFKKLDNIVVEGKADKRELVLAPDSTVIDTGNHEAIGQATSVLDYIGALAIIDFRSITDLTPEEDSITMRGFSSNRFVTAIDGLTSQKTGGRKGSHIVDYALTPAFLIDKIEILPGPHTALYDAKALGGVVNMVTKAPERKDSLKPHITLKSSYGSFNTLNANLSLQGSASAFTYDVGYQKNSTDGYLRQSEADIQTIFTRLGAVLPYEGYMTFSSSYSAADRKTPVNNNRDTDDYDPDYPETEGSLFDAWQNPTWDKKAWAYRLNYLQNLPIGKVSLGAYTSMEDRDRAYRDWADSEDHGLGIEYLSGVTTWKQQGGKIMDELTWAANHTTTVGCDLARLYDGLNKDERVNKKGAFLQHQWGIFPFLDLKLGLRYEDVEIHVSNNPARYITDKGEWIIRDFDKIIPKSFLTWKMDSLADVFRDTSLSLGISKIWHAPDFHGDYNPQGRPAGAWLEPEHGMGYDLIFMRRLFGEVHLKLDYSFYDIKDYMATNSKYAENSDCSDYKINLEEVYRHGVELELDGKLAENLSFYLTHAWQKYENRGDEPAGKDNLDDAPDHRVSCGLRYTVFEKTTFMLDYQYQTKEVMEVSEEFDHDGDPLTDPIYTWYQVENPAYSLVNVGIKHTLFKKRGFMKNADVSGYVKNLFDEVYYNSRGYPSTERTYGVSLSVSL